MKKFLISLIVTPSRVRKIVARAVSWLLYLAVVRGSWEFISSFSVWLRKLADFIDTWNETDLTVEKDKLVADLVAEAVTDEAVGKLIDCVTAMKASNGEVAEE